MAEGRFEMAGGPSANAQTGFAPALPHDVSKLIGPDDFQGTWDVRRRIVDHLSGAVHHFAGKAVIGASEFSETGNVSYGTFSLKAARRYLLRSQENDLAIAFADGRPFIRLDGRASQAVRHLCGDDDYRGRFFFRSTDTWVEEWRVAGPRKRYVSLARYRRHRD